MPVPYYSPWQRRPPPPPRSEEPPPPTMLAEQAAEFQEKPFGSSGEMTVLSQPESHGTGLSWGPGLEIEPVDWDEERREWLERERLEEENE